MKLSTIGKVQWVQAWAGFDILNILFRDHMCSMTDKESTEHPVQGPCFGDRGTPLIIKENQRYVHIVKTHYHYYYAFLLLGSWQPEFSANA